MRIYKSLTLLTGLVPSIASAGLQSIEDVLRHVHTECSQVEDKLEDLKTMAGINTAITAVGTGMGAGALAAGIKKVKVDDLLSVELTEYRKSLEGKGKQPTSTRAEAQAFANYKFDFMAYERSLPTAEESAAAKDTAETNSKIEKLEKQSKTLGNVRTGLLGGTTATGVAGAIIASKNRTDVSLHDQIDRCVNAINVLKATNLIAKVSGQPNFDADEVIRACEAYETIDLSKIDNRATGAMASSIVTATTGAAGTVTSAIANADKIRDDDSSAGIQKEKNLNTAANVLAAGATVSSAIATVFNATQIAAIKQLIEVTEKCSDAL